MKEPLSKKEFKAIYDTWFEPVRNFLYYKTGDIGLTEDLLQDVFVKLWENRSKVKRDTVKSYLYKIAQNLAINQLKKQQTAFRFMARQNAGIFDEDTAENRLEQEEMDRALQKALAGLPEKQRVVLLMHKMERLSHKEIAARLDISVKAVEKRMHKAMETLRNQLSSFG